MKKLRIVLALLLCPHGYRVVRAADVVDKGHLNGVLVRAAWEAVRTNDKRLHAWACELKKYFC